MMLDFYGMRVDLESTHPSIESKQGSRVLWLTRITTAIDLSIYLSSWRGYASW